MAEKITENDELKRQREEYEKIISKLNSEKKAYEQVYKKFESIEKNMKQIANVPNLIFIKAEAELAIQDKKSTKKSNQGKEDKPYIIHEVTMEYTEAMPQMGAVQLVTTSLEGYLASIYNSLQINNHNNLSWNALNNTVLSNINNALLITNTEIGSLRDEIKNIKGINGEAGKGDEDDTVGSFLGALGAVGSLTTLTGAGGVVGTAAKAAGPIGLVGSVLYYGGKLADKATDAMREKIHGERVTKTRYASGLQYLLPNLGIVNRVAETENIKTGEVTKYNWWGSKKESYNPNTGEKKIYGWFDNVKDTKFVGKAGDMQTQSSIISDAIAKSADKFNIAADLASTKIGMNIEGMRNPMTTAGLLNSNVEVPTNTGINLPLNTQGGGIEEKLALIQGSSTENMNALALLWDTYLQKVSQVYDMILLTISMKHMLMTMNTLLTILNLYLTWMTLPPMLEGVWQQILSGADIFLSNLKSKFTAAISEIKQKMLELSSVSINPPSSGGGAPGHKYTGTGFWKGGLTYVGERGRELIQYPTGERFMAEAKMLMNLPKGTKIFRNSMTERIMNNGFSGNNMMTADENNQLKKLGGFNGLSDYTDSKFGGGINYSSVKADNITVNITNTYGNQSPAQIKDTNNDLVRKINEVLFQKEDRKRRVSIG